MEKTPPPTDPNRLVVFTIYAFLVGLLATLTPEAIKELVRPSEEATYWHPFYCWLGNAVALLVCFVFFDPQVKRWFRPRYSPAPLALSTHYKVRSVKGLLLLVSRSPGFHSALSAVDYHGRTLSHVWLVHSSDPGSVAGAAEVRRHCSEVAPSVVVIDRPIASMFSIEMAKALVEGVRGEAHASGITDEDFICDFTGMNKPVSAGVVLACIRPGHRLQYMEPDAVLPSGEPDQQAGSHPTEVDVNYDVELVQESQAQ